MKREIETDRKEIEMLKEEIKKLKRKSTYENYWKLTREDSTELEYKNRIDRRELESKIERNKIKRKL